MDENVWNIEDIQERMNVMESIAAADKAVANPGIVVTSNIASNRPEAMKSVENRLAYMGLKEEDISRHMNWDESEHLIKYGPVYEAFYISTVLDYFKKKSPMPGLLQMVEDRDLEGETLAKDFHWSIYHILTSYKSEFDLSDLIVACESVASIYGFDNGGRGELTKGFAKAEPEANERWKEYRQLFPREEIPHAKQVKINKLRKIAVPLRTMLRTTYEVLKSVAKSPQRDQVFNDEFTVNGFIRNLNQFKKSRIRGVGSTDTAFNTGDLNRALKEFLEFNL